MNTPDQPAGVYRWIDEGHIAVGDAVFRLMGEPGPKPDAAHREFFLMKPRGLVGRYLRHADEFSGGQIVEAGVYRGGSTAFLAALLEPEKLVAIDLDKDRNVWLDRWLEARGQSDSVRLYHGVDQADRGTLGQLLADEFAGRPLDLVIDDASHLLTPTTATFNMLFPRLRPGGLYVIEDWSGDLVLRQLLSRKADELAEWVRNNPGLVTKSRTERREDEMWRLVLSLVVALGSNEDLIPEMEIARDFAAFRRGPVDLDPDAFDLADWVPDPPV